MSKKRTGDGLAPALLRVYLLALSVTLFGGATLTYLAERRDSDANIDSIGDALWWSLVTVTTVGYGDRVPVTAVGRAVGIVLIVCGIGLFSVFTATIAAYFVDRDAGDGFNEIESNQAVIESNQETIAQNQQSMESHQAAMARNQDQLKLELADVHSKLDALTGLLDRRGGGSDMPKQNVAPESVQSR